MFGSVKSSLLSCDPIPSVDEAYIMLMQEEDLKSASHALDTKSDFMAYAIQYASVSGPSHAPIPREDISNLYCTSCGHNGHFADNCFYTLDYSNW